MRTDDGDEVDRLVSHSIRQGSTDDYNRGLHDRSGAINCELCSGPWHGLGRPEGCPGAWATEEAAQEYRKQRREASIPQTTGFMGMLAWIMGFEGGDD